VTINSSSKNFSVMRKSVYRIVMQMYLTDTRGWCCNAAAETNLPLLWPTEKKHLIINGTRQENVTQSNLLKCKYYFF